MKNVLNRSLSFLAVSVATLSVSSFGFAAQHAKKHALTVAKADTNCAVIGNTETKVLYKHGDKDYQKMLKESKNPGAKTECFVSVSAAEKAGYHAYSTAKAAPKTTKP